MALEAARISKATGRPILLQWSREEEFALGPARPACVRALAPFLGIMGVALLTAILGRRPNPVVAVVLGAAYGIAVEAILINGIVNTQKIQTLYSSTPHWSWWVGHGIFGATLGLLSSVVLQKHGRLAR